MSGMDFNDMLAGAKTLASVDTNAAIFRCRQLAEAITKSLADAHEVEISGIPLVEQINAVARGAGLPGSTVRALHNLRILGNQAAHHHLSGDEEAESALALCEEIIAGTKGLLPLEALPEPDNISGLEAVQAAPEAEVDPRTLVDAVKALLHQARTHELSMVSVTALKSFSLLDPAVLLQLSTSGVPRQALEEAGLICRKAKGQPSDLKDIGELGSLGFRLIGPQTYVVRLIVPPASSPARDLGLNPLGEAFLDAICNATYMEGRLGRTDLLRQLRAGLTSARALWLQNSDWPDSISYADMRSAVLAAFQWPGGPRQFLLARKGHRLTPWKDICGSAPGWVAMANGAEVVGHR